MSQHPYLLGILAGLIILIVAAAGRRDG